MQEVEIKGLEDYDPNTSIDDDESTYDPKSPFQKPLLVQEAMRACREARGQEMTKGFWNNKLDKNGNAIRTWIEDQRKIFINRVIALKILLTAECEADEKYKDNMKEVDNKIQSLFNKYAYTEFEFDDASGGGGRSSPGGGGNQLLLSEEEAIRQDNEERARREQVRREQERLDVAAQQAEQTRIQQEVSSGKLTSQAKGFGAFVSQPGYQSGFATSTGKFYPTSNKDFTPQGYARGSYSGFDTASGSFMLNAPSGYSGSSGTTNTFATQTSRPEPLPIENLLGMSVGAPVKAKEIRTITIIKNKEEEFKLLRFGKVIGMASRGLGKATEYAESGLERVTGRTFKDSISIGGRSVSLRGNLFSEENLRFAAATPVFGTQFFTGRMSATAQGGSLIPSIGKPLRNVAPQQSETVFFQRPASVTTEGLTRTETAAITSVKGKYSNTKIYSGAITETQVEGNLFKSRTFGMSAEVKGFDPLRGQVLNKNKPFAGVSAGRTFEVNERLTLMAGMQKTQYAGSQPNYAIFSGGSMKINEQFELLAGLSKPVTRGGKVIGDKSSSIGFGKLQGSFDDIATETYFTRSAKSPKSVGQITNQNVITQNVRSMIAPRQVTSVPRAATTTQPRAALELKQERKTSTYSGLGMYERTESLFASKVILKSGLTFTNLSMQRNRLYTLPLQPMRSLQGQRSSQASAYGLAQVPMQAQAGRYRFDRGSTSRITPPTNFKLPRIPVPIFPLGGGLFLNTRQGRSYALRGSFKASYTPSLLASTFRLFGTVPKRFRSGNVDPFGTRFISSGKRRKKKRK